MKDGKDILHQIWTVLYIIWPYGYFKTYFTFPTISEVDKIDLLIMQEYFQTTYKFLELSPHVIVPMHGRVNLWPKRMLCQYLKYETALFPPLPSQYKFTYHMIYRIIHWRNFPGIYFNSQSPGNIILTLLISYLLNLRKN